LQPRGFVEAFKAEESWCGGVGVLSSEEKRRFLRALSEDEEFRYAVAGLLGLGAVLDELRKLREDFNKHIEQEEKRWRENEKRWEANERRWEENEKRWREAFKRFEAIEAELARLREDFNKMREDFNRLYVQVNRRLDSFERRLIALGARWGVESEETFREAMKGVLEEILGTAEVGKWVYFDEGGEVFGRPARVEVDLLVRDDAHILVELKASASEGDVAKLWRVGNLYAKVTGVKPRLVLVSPFVEERALELARELGVEVYTAT
jgi:hypothetical protein